ncbi:unnamed protein product [Closterium sp. Naga37s-1]|nr:unnamed protein product [Closterium sp. Naga37s-1]
MFTKDVAPVVPVLFPPLPLLPTALLLPLPTRLFCSSLSPLRRSLVISLYSSLYSFRCSLPCTLPCTLPCSLPCSFISPFLCSIRRVRASSPLSSYMRPRRIPLPLSSRPAPTLRPCFPCFPPSSPYPRSLRGGRQIIISRGYEEDHTLSNVKMVICAAACAVACVAQFYPRKFPDNRALLLACIVLYPPRRHPPPSLPALPSQFHAPAIPPCCPFHQSPTLVAVPRSPVACLAHRLPTLLTAPTPDSPPPLATHALPSPWPLGLYPPAPPPLRPPPLLLTRPLMDSCCLPSVVAP